MNAFNSVCVQNAVSRRTALQLRVAAPCSRVLNTVQHQSTRYDKARGFEPYRWAKLSTCWCSQTQDQNITNRSTWIGKHTKLLSCSKSLEITLLFSGGDKNEQKLTIY
eukprot:786648-Amphidinium_carterae.1